MTYFISDVHLGLQQRDLDKIREDELIAFLDKIKFDCTKLFILGDLFDYWFEYQSVIPKYYYRTLAKLHELKVMGIEIEYLMGNHDFGHLNFFMKEFGIEVHKDDIVRTINNKKFYLSHGDGKAHKDEVYRFIKKILRSKWANKFFRFIHPDIGIKLAHSSSKTSRSYTDNKNYGNTEGMEEFAIKKINEGYDFVIMGHRHRLIYKEFEKGVYINLGDWIKKPHYGFFDGEKFHITEVNKKR
jgi:UDP-2,3-diacylglucosamine hydrolase